ncbi:MAG: oligosaccharide flippase family protein [bacterium]
MAKFSLSDKVAIVVLSNVISGVSGLVLSMILVRILSISDYGTYKQIMLISTIVTVIFSLGIPRSIAYFIPRVKIERAGFVIQSIIILSLLGLTSSCILWCLSKNIGDYFNNPDLSKLLKILSIYLFFTFPAAYFNYLLLAVDRQKLSAGLSIVNTIIAFIVIIPLFLGYGLAGLINWMVVFGSISCGLMLFYTVYLMKGWEFNWNPQLLRSQLKYTLPRGLAEIVGGLGVMVDKIVISIFFSVQRYAIYAVGTSKVALVEMLFLPAGNVLMPKFSELHHQSRKEELIQLWHKYISKIALIILPIFVFLFTMGEEIITLLFTKNYIESTNIFRIYLCALPVRMLLYGEVLEGIGQTKPIFAGAALFFISNVILNLLFVQIMGFIGPAIGILLSAYLTIFFYFFIIKHSLKIPFDGILPWRNLINIFIVASGCGLLIYPITIFNYPDLFTLLMAGLVFISVYIILIFKIGIITSEDIEFIKRWLSLRIWSSQTMKETR